MPKDYLREFDDRWPYLKNDNGVVSELKAFLAEVITASKQEGRAEAVAYIRNKAPRSGTHGYVIHSSTLDDALMFDYRAAKEEKV